MLPIQIEDKLSTYAAHHLLRERHIIEKQNEAHAIINGQPIIHFCHNDYLNISQHPKIKKAFIQGVEQYGLGSGASAMVSGYSKAHAHLEEAFAAFLKREKAILFNSGYHANLGLLNMLADRHSHVIADKYCHASLIDGIVLSRAKHFRYQHNHAAHAEQLLKKFADKNPLLVTESIFSMQGDIADVKKLAMLAALYHATLIVDDAHGIGVLGKEGAGICEQEQLSQQDVAYLVTPLGKALGSFGAVVSGSQKRIDALLQFARTYRYSTALPPAVCHATIAALNIIATESWRREKLKHLIRFFNHAAKERALPLFSFADTPIRSIVIGANKATLYIQKQLLQQGLFVSCIRPPTVPINTACIRISLNCAHSESQIIFLLDQLRDCLSQQEKQNHL